MNINRAGLHIDIISPYGFEQIFAGKNLTRNFHQGFQQPELGRAEVNIIIAAVNLFGFHIHNNIFKSQFFFGLRFRRAADIGFDPGHQFGNGKRLGNIIVRTRGQAFNLVLLLAFGGKHDNRNIFNIRLVANQLTYLNAGKLRKHPVQKNNRRAGLFYLGDGFAAAGFPYDVITFFFKIIFENQRQGLFVLNNHNRMFHVVLPCCFSSSESRIRILS